MRCPQMLQAPGRELPLFAGGRRTGVALGQGGIVADDLAAGRLMTPFALRIPSGLAYYLVAPAEMFQSPKLTTFQRWRRREIASAGH